MEWKTVSPWYGISRLYSEYHLQDRRIPSGNFKVIVLETTCGFCALSNVSTRDSYGSPDGQAGMATTELEALKKVLDYGFGQQSAKDSWTEEELEWSDPHDF